jgi:hypothetical protein
MLANLIELTIGKKMIRHAKIFYGLQIGGWAKVLDQPDVIYLFDDAADQNAHAKGAGSGC